MIMEIFGIWFSLLSLGRIINATWNKFQAKKFNFISKTARSLQPEQISHLLRWLFSLFCKAFRLVRVSQIKNSLSPPFTRTGYSKFTYFSSIYEKYSPRYDGLRLGVCLMIARKEFTWLALEQLLTYIDIIKAISRN